LRTKLAGRIVVGRILNGIGHVDAKIVIATCLSESTLSSKQCNKTEGKNDKGRGREPKELAHPDKSKSFFVRAFLQFTQICPSSD
jgi:hypothetical protein